MQLTWYGQAAFRLVDAGGYRIVCDPYDPELLGYAPIRDECDLVITSSANDQAHCRHDLVPGEHRWLNALDAARAGGSTTIDGREIRAVEAMEMEDHPHHDPEQNAMYRIEMDGLHVAHMGDIGNPLSERQLRFLDGTDVLLALAGGSPVITHDELERVVAETRPRLVVPMHYQTPVMRPPGMLGIAALLERLDPADVDRAPGTSVTITRETLPERTRYRVVNHAR